MANSKTASGRDGFKRISRTARAGTSPRDDGELPRGDTRVDRLEELLTSTGEGTGVAPFATCFGPRTAAAGFTGRTWLTTSQSPSMRIFSSPARRDHRLRGRRQHLRRHSGHHLSPAGSTTDERLEPPEVLPERLDQRVEPRQGVLRPIEPYLDPPRSTDTHRAGPPASWSRRAPCTGTRSAGPARRPRARLSSSTRNAARRCSGAAAGASSAAAFSGCR